MWTKKAETKNSDKLFNSAMEWIKTGSIIEDFLLDDLHEEGFDFTEEEIKEVKERLKNLKI